MNSHTFIAWQQIAKSEYERLSLFLNQFKPFINVSLPQGQIVVYGGMGMDRRW
jgi:hypothetical protein